MLDVGCISNQAVEYKAQPDRLGNVRGLVLRCLAGLSNVPGDIWLGRGLQGQWGLEQAPGM